MCLLLVNSTKYASESSWRDLQDLLTFASLRPQTFSKTSSNLYATPKMNFQYRIISPQRRTCKSCRSRQELSNEYLLAKFGFDTAENEPCKVCRALTLPPPYLRRTPMYAAEVMLEEERADPQLLMEDLKAGGATPGPRIQRLATASGDVCSNSKFLLRIFF